MSAAEMDEEDYERGAARAASLRAQAAEGGLRFEAYLPSDMAVWLLDKIERGVFIDPSEAVFVMLCEFRDIEPHGDLRREAMDRSVQAAMDDPSPAIPSEDVFAELEARLAEPRPEPAIWRRPG
jgi:antitoxin ParD1/3/4